MDLDFLNPISSEWIEKFRSGHPSSLGNKITFLSSTDSFSELKDFKMAILGVRETRRMDFKGETEVDFSGIRSSLYGLFWGNWEEKIIDLGDILPGSRVEDTEFALKEVVSALLESGVLPIILGGSHDMAYAQYRAYDSLHRMINFVNIDSGFDIGNTEEEITDHSFVGKMIVSEPYHLNNYINLGYQSYLNPPEEIELIDRLFFEAYRLGDLTADIKTAEPLLRNADMVNIDLNAIAGGYSGSVLPQPNGFDGREICALARYAGMSDKVTSFGFYNLQLVPDFRDALFAAEVLWYFIEGVNFRKEEEMGDSGKFKKYNVPIDRETLIFYRSKRTDRWWVEIPMESENKSANKTFLPCSYGDYLQACNQIFPERWLKIRQKNVL